MVSRVTSAQESFFRDRGYLFLKGAIAQDAVRPLRRHILHELKKQRIWSAGKTLSRRMKDLPAFQQITTLGQLIKYPELQNSIVSRDLLSKMEILAGANVVSTQDAKLLLSLPNQGKWTSENLNWHVDISSSTLDRSPGIQVFVVIDQVSPHGGATLALAGSHLLKRSKCHQNNRLYDRLRTGASRDMVIDGVDLSVLEMTGHPGDVYLMDMRVLHTPSVNSTKHVRMMATVRCFTKCQRLI